MMALTSKMDWALDVCLSTSINMLQSAALQVRKHGQTDEDYYDVVNRHRDYEERFYPSAIYVCTLVTNVYQDSAKTEAFRTLQSYAMGENKDGAYLTMKPPILTQVVCDTNVAFERKFIVCAYLSSDVTAMFPESTNQNVFIKTIPDMTVFVKTFEGLSSDERWTQETRRFTETLKQRENIRTDFFITATYDSPFQLVSTRNEIWLVKYSNQTHRALADDETEMIQIGSSRLEVPSVVSWCLYGMMMYFSFIVFMVKSVVNPGMYVKNNWSRIKRNGLTSIKHVRSALKWENVKLVTKVGMAVSKFITKFSFELASAVSESAGLSFKTTS